MTTKVLVVNFGPERVLVRGFALDNERGDFDINYRSAVMLEPQTSHEFYVHRNQSLTVTEELRHAPA